MEWYFTFEQGMYETHMHLPICVDMRNVFQISETPITWELPLVVRFEDIGNKWYVSMYIV